MAGHHLALAGGLQIVAYVKVAALVLVVYDWLIVLDLEVQYIWKSRWTFPKIIYLISRYSPLADTLISVYERGALSRPSVELCNTTMKIATIAAGAGMGVSEILIMTRTWALYDRSKLILVVFLASWLILSSVNIWAVIQWADSFSVQSLPLVEMYGCYLESFSKIGLVCYISFMASETVVVILTVYKCIQTFLQSGGAHSKLVKSFYRDGILYYLCLLPFTVANVLLLELAPPGYLLLMETPLRVSHAILSCRLLLHVRAVAAEDDIASLPTIVFKSASSSEENELQIGSPRNTRNLEGGVRNPV